jgi:hypothetical protein
VCSNIIGKQALSYSPSQLAKAVQMAIFRDFGQSVDLSVTDPNIPSALIYVSQQKKDLLKKFFSGDSNKTLERLAFDKFGFMNQHMLNVNLSFFGLNTNIQTCNEVERTLLRARFFIRSLLEPLNLEDLFLHCKHSSGTSIGLKFVQTNLDDKWTFPLTGTSSACKLFSLYLDFDPELRLAIQEANRYSDQPMYKEVEYSRATTVPKDDKINRMIAVEATLNMYFQQGLMSLLEECLRPWVDIRLAQEKHGTLAWLSSITGEASTIDFMSASDCVSTDYLNWFLPPDWFGALFMCSHREMSINGVITTLNMFSTMGNATTFPIETLILLGIAYAVSHQYSSKFTLIPKESLGVFSVYGDDCIVPTIVTPLFIKACTMVGFLVNDEKTFTGSVPFRESCGYDYYRGYNVRPFMIKAPTGERPSDYEAWLYIIFNSLSEKYISYFGNLSYCYGKHVFKVIGSLFKKFDLKVKIVPSYFPQDSGIQYNGDIRLLRCFKHCTMSQISIDTHGTASFSFLRYVYRDKRQTHSHISYATRLKTDYLRGPKRPIDILTNVSDDENKYVVKRLGRYSSSKGLGDLPRSLSNYSLI